MKKILFIVIFIMIAINAKSQDISYSPIAFKAWGITTNYLELSVGYKSVKVHMFHNYKVLYDKHRNNTYDNFALSYKPLKIKFLNLGLIYFYKPFPTKSGTNLNLYFDFELKIDKSLSVSYIHISNCYTGKINPGIDFIQLTLKL